MYVTHFFTHGVIEGAEPFSPLCSSPSVDRLCIQRALRVVRHTPRQMGHDEKAPVDNSAPRPPLLDGKSAKRVKSCSAPDPEIGRRSENERLFAARTGFSPALSSDCQSARQYRSQRSDRFVYYLRYKFHLSRHIPILSEQFTRFLNLTRLSRNC